MSEQEPKTVEETKPQTGSADSDAPVAKTSSNNMMFAVVGVVALVAAAIAGAFVFFSGESDSDDTFSEDSGISGIEESVKVNAKSALEIIDFENFDENNLSSLVDYDKARELDSSISGNVLLGGSEMDLSGKTVEMAMDMAIEANGGSDDRKVELSMDVYVQYPENYNELGLDSIENLNEYFAELDASEIMDMYPDFFIKGEFNVDIPGQKGRGDFELTVVDFVGYLKINDLELAGVSAAEVNEIKGQVLAVDLSDQIEEMLGQYLMMLNSYTGDVNPAAELLMQDPEELLTMMFDEMQADMSEEDAATLRRIGPKIVDSLETTIDEYTMFTNVKSPDPIRSGSDSKCQNADLDFAGILDTTEMGILDLAKVISADEAYEGDDYDSIERDVNDSFDEARSELKKSDLRFGFTFCTNRDEEYMSGMGMKMGVNSDGQDIEMSVNYLIVDFDSSMDIKAPKVDMDLTEFVIPALEQSGFTGGTSPLVPADPFDSYDYGSSDSSYDAYYEEFDVIFKQWLDGDITDSEYDALIEELDMKYYGDSYDSSTSDYGDVDYEAYGDEIDSLTDKWINGDVSDEEYIKKSILNIMVNYTNI
ncbi:MAG: hypothetical protein Q9M91_06720 [Candidatus Dojkabacteria bacterium]|nr:hypothetical protein [Candidatus Dojkabacteria bacterium]MDQ7021489.1 hypothetical protein [Candidatus Dojkabacteria bacterium]